MLHDKVGYTPYEGRHLTGWPVTVLSRGRVVVEDGRLEAERGSGDFLPCALSDAAKPARPADAELAYAAELPAAALALEQCPNDACAITQPRAYAPEHDVPL